MLHEESTYPADWIRLAEKDLLRVDRLLGLSDPALAGFCLQQSIEKFLKAFLLCHGWKLRRIHHLDTLIDDAILYDDSLEDFRPICLKITSFYFLERYPSFELKISDKDVQDALQQVMGLVVLIREKFEH